jgi:hypothetical protein
LRVINGEPVSSDVAFRVARTIEAVGPPSARSRADVAPAERRVGSEADELVSRVDQMAADLQARLPENVGSIVCEAIRVEVRPVTRHIAELDALFELIRARLEDIGAEIEHERRERVEDVALLSELITTGWRSADRRLARLEHMLARLQESIAGERGPRIVQFRSAAERDESV